MDQRTAWSAAGGVVMATSGTNAAAWAVGASTTGSHLPMWPAFVFGALALIGAYVTIASLARWWPFSRLRLGSADMLDSCIIDGQQARGALIYGKLSTQEMSRVAGEFFLRTINKLDTEFPAIADEFRLASGDQSKFAGQALLIDTINRKLRVLTDIRKRSA